MNTTAVIVAAGAGARMNGPVPKAFILLAGCPLFEHSLRTFQQHAGIDAIVVVVPGSMQDEAGKTTGAYGKVSAVLPGGTHRQESVRIALDHLKATAAEDDLVLIHDAARPLVPADLITAVLEAAGRSGAALPGLRPVDTMRTVEGNPERGNGLAGETLNRDRLARIQTPQGFRFGLILDALRRQGAAGDVTDDAALVLRAGHPVEVVPGSPRNFKVTTPDDLVMAAAFLS